MAASETLADVIMKAQRKQMEMTRLTATFRVRHEVDLALVPPDVRRTYVNLTYNGGSADGVLWWWRDGERQRINWVFDIPDEYKRQTYEDVLVVAGQDKIVEQILRTGQIAVIGPGGVPCSSPLDWFFLEAGESWARRRPARDGSWQAPSGAMAARSWCCVLTISAPLATWRA